MTGGARKRLSKTVTLMCQATKPKWIKNEVTGQWQYHRMSFITLTVSSTKRMLTAKEAYPILLKPFIRWMRERPGASKMYVWKAELQQRGQIHYHITTPDWIHYLEIRNKWNALQREAGLLDEYAAQHMHFNANSTDVHETRHIRNMSNYLVKELAKTVDARKLKAKKKVDIEIATGQIKEEDRQKYIDLYTGEEMKTEGKIWGCSENLEGAQYFSVPMRAEIGELLMAWSKAGEVREIKGDWWSLIYLSDKAPPDLLNAAEQKIFEQHLSAIRDNKDTDDITTLVPAEMVSDKADKMQSMDWSQLSFYFN